MGTAWEITRATVAYTNHTLMPEALEQWPVSLLERVVPRHLQIIYEINRRFMADAGEFWRDDPESERLKRVSIVQEGYEAPDSDGASGDRRQPFDQWRVGAALGAGQDAAGARLL